MEIAGSTDIGGEMGLDQGGAKPKAKDFLDDLGKATHKDLYHMVLDFNPREWEAVREAAHQLMGGAASDMWGSIGEGGSMYIGGGDDEPSYSDLKDVLMTPSRGAAGRLLELEHDAGGAGFKKALKKSVKHAKKIFKGSKKHLSTLNSIAAEVSEMGGPVGDYAKQIHNVTNPTLENVNKAERIANAVANAKPSDLGNTRENIRTGVQLANAALTGNSARERAENVANVGREKIREKYGSGMDFPGGAEEIGGANSIVAGAEDIGGGSGMYAGAEDIGGGSGMQAGAMEVGAGNVGPAKKKRKGGKTHREIKKTKRAKSPEPLPLDKASASAQTPAAVDYSHGRKLHDPRKRR